MGFHGLVRYQNRDQDPSLLAIHEAIKSQVPELRGWTLIIFDEVGFQTLGNGTIPSLRLLDDALERTRIDALEKGHVGTMDRTRFKQEPKK